jgi:hypothetical protein
MHLSCFTSISRIASIRGQCLNLNMLIWPSISNFPSTASTFQKLLLLQLTPSYRIDIKSLCISSVPNINIYFHNINFEICWNIFIWWYLSITVISLRNIIGGPETCSIILKAHFPINAILKWRWWFKTVRIDKDNNIYSVKLQTNEYVRRRHFPLTVGRWSGSPSAIS